MTMGIVLVSACLMGANCKYNGGNNLDAAVVDFVKDKQVLLVCPEMLAGLGLPRIPIEIRDGVVIRADGKNVDAPLRRAVEQTLQMIQNMDIECAILKSRSPTCGVKEVYDGTFSGTKIPGSGILAKALMDAGIRVIDAEDF